VDQGRDRGLRLSCSYWQLEIGTDQFWSLLGQAGSVAIGSTSSCIHQHLQHHQVYQGKSYRSVIVLSIPALI